VNKAVILLFAASVSLLLNFLVPPYQNPDEPQHFGAVLLYTLGNDREAYIEEQIIIDMDRHNWWRYVGMGRPVELPKRFRDIPFLNFSDFAGATGNLVLYHFTLGKLLGLLPTADIRILYYCGRMFSALLFWGSILLFASAFQVISEKLDSSLGWGIFFILFLPQLNIISISVNPEIAAVFLGALFFYALIRLLAGNRMICPLLLLFVSAGFGFFTDRSSLYLAPLAVLLPAWLIKRERPAKSLATFAVYLILGLTAVSWAAWYYPAPFFRALSTVRNHLLQNITRVGTFLARADFNKKFFPMLIDSFWLRFGWMAFRAEMFIYYVWRAAAAGAILGLGVFAAKSALSKLKTSPGSGRGSWLGKLVGISALAVGIQLTAIWLMAHSTNVFSQGRYFFPVIFPVSLLFLVGFKSLFDLVHREAGTIALKIFFLLELFFFAAAIWNSLAPAFHLAIRSPHPGI
jgi:hypothetical protein